MTRPLDSEISTLNERFLQFGKLVEDTVNLSVKILRESSTSDYDVVKKNESIINQTEIEIEEDCLSIIARHQPLAKDLRHIISILKMNNDLERISDLAVRISSKANKFYQGTPEDESSETVSLLGKVSKHVCQQVNDSLAAINSQEVAKATHVIVSDKKIEALKVDAKHHLLNKIREDQNSITYLIGILRILNHLERISNLCTNIAEDVIYLVEGRIARHEH